VEKLLLDPLTFLLKKEISEDAMSAAPKAHRPLMTDLLDNRDKAMFAYDELPHEAGLSASKAMARKIIFKDRVFHSTR